MKKIVLLVLFFLFLNPAKVLAAGEIVFEDEFDNLSSWQINKTGNANASTITNLVYSGNSALSLTRNTSADSVNIVKTFSTNQTGEVSVYFYDDLSSTLVTFISVRDGDLITDHNSMVGVRADLYPNTYYARVGTNDPASGFDTQIARTQGWHRFDIEVTSAGSFVKIDGFSLVYYPQRIGGGIGGGLAKDLKSFNKINIATTWSGMLAPAVWDKLVIRNSPAVPDPKTYAVNYLQNFLDSYTSDGCTFHNPAGLYKGYDGTVRTLSGTSVAAYVLWINTKNQKWKDIGLNCLYSIVDNYSLWKINKSIYSPYSTSSFGLTALLWNKEITDGTRKNQIKEVARSEAEIIIARNPLVDSGYAGNSMGETNSWISSALSLISFVYPEHPRASVWRQYSRAAAYHTFTTSQDVADQILGLKTQTLWDDYSFDNHGQHLNTEYAVDGAIQGLSEGAIPYYLNNEPIPEEFKHNVINVWNRHKQFTNFNNLLFQNSPDFTDIFGDKTETGWDTANSAGAYAYLEKIFNISLVNKFVEVKSQLQYPGLVIPKNGGPWVCVRKNVYGGNPNENVCESNFNYDDNRLINSAVAYREALLYLWMFKPQINLALPTPGDLDKNGYVDIFDYNLLVGNFGNTTCGNVADIDDTCMVDIFDYNILVGNFGK